MAVLVAKGKNGRPRGLPLNGTEQKVFFHLVGNATTNGWLYTNPKGLRSCYLGTMTAAQDNLETAVQLEQDLDRGKWSGSQKVG